MKFTAVLSSFLLLSNCLLSQSVIVTQATHFITENKYPEAEHYLDSILKKNHRNVDALMMKGNVLLNYAWQNTSKYYFNREKAETVFDTGLTISGFYAPIIPRDTEQQIARYWKECLLLDSTRNDIRKGLCNLYSISLDTIALKQQLWQMKTFMVSNDDNAFLFAEYARNIKARGQFDEALQIYAVIANIFPNLAGIRCDMAGEYFYHGQPNDALRYVDSTMTKKEIDQTSFINAAAIYSMLGYYDKALEIFNLYSVQDTLLEGDFYKALVLFARMDTAVLPALLGFIQKANEQSYYDEVQLAKKLLPYATNSFGIDDYLQIIGNKNIPDYYKVLIYQRGMRQFKNTCEPLMEYGIFQCQQRNFSIATQFLEEIDNCEAHNPFDTEYWMLAYAYTLFMQHDHQKALAQFGLLLGSNNNFTIQAALYFSAQILKEQGKPEDARMFLQKLVHEKKGTKYGQLASFDL